MSETLHFHTTDYATAVCVLWVSGCDDEIVTDRRLRKKLILYWGWIINRSSIISNYKSGSTERTVSTALSLHPSLVSEALNRSVMFGISIFLHWAPRLWGRTSIFGVVFFVFKSLGNWETEETFKKYHLRVLWILQHSSALRQSLGNEEKAALKTYDLIRHALWKISLHTSQMAH